MSRGPAWPERVFVSGTDTGVGKTLVAAALAVGLGATYWKPVQSGMAEGGDTAWVGQHAALPATRLAAETYRLEAPLSPHAAAALEGVRIDLEGIVPPAASPLVCEGAGGVLVPLNWQQTMADLMQRLGMPVVVVARSSLGTINHTLLTLEALRRRGLTVWGVVLNGPPNDGNRAAIEAYGEVEVVGHVQPLDRVDAAALEGVFGDSLWGRRG